MEGLAVGVGGGRNLTWVLDMPKWTRQTAVGKAGASVRALKEERRPLGEAWSPGYRHFLLPGLPCVKRMATQSEPLRFPTADPEV